MTPEEYAALSAMEDGYWWHLGRRELLRRLLASELPPAPPGGREVLDVGCGTGGNLDLLAEFGRVRGLEPPGPGLDACRARGLGEEQVVAGEADALPFADATFDLVCLLEVIEHLEQDLPALLEARRVLRPGGHLLVTVPAYRFLWSVHDEALGHRRRYMASEVHQRLNEAGFHVVRRSYAVLLPLPLIVGFRVAQGLLPSLHRRGASYVRLPGPLNSLLARSLSLESRAMDWLDLPAGSSIVALGRR